MLKSEVAPGFKSLCRHSQPITSVLFGDELPQSIRELFGDELPQSIRELFGDELPQSIRDISQVERMAAKFVNSSKRKGHGQQLSQSYNKRRNYGESRSSERSTNWRDYSLNYHRSHREQLSPKADHRRSDQNQV